MCEENNTETLEKLIEISSLLYVLQIALNNDDQPTKDTTPFSDFTKTIMHKIHKIIETLNSRRFINNNF